MAYLFVLFAAAVHLRFLALPWSFTPITASLLFFGARVPLRRMWIPLVLLAASDVYLTRVTYAYPLTADHFVTWAWYAAMILLGATLTRTTSPLRIGTTSLAASVSFFLVSNAAVWMVWRDMYPGTFNGLMMSYVAGLPFFRNAVVSDMFFTAVFFGIGYLVQQRQAASERVLRA